MFCLAILRHSCFHVNFKITLGHYKKSPAGDFTWICKGGIILVLNHPTKAIVSLSFGQMLFIHISGLKNICVLLQLVKYILRYFGLLLSIVNCLHLSCPRQRKQTSFFSLLLSSLPPSFLPFLPSFPPSVLSLFLLKILNNVKRQ